MHAVVEHGSDSWFVAAAGLIVFDWCYDCFCACFAEEQARSAPQFLVLM